MALAVSGQPDNQRVSGWGHIPRWLEVWQRVHRAEQPREGLGGQQTGISSPHGGDVVRPGAVFQQETKRMSILVDDFYRSSNGDRWQLLRDTACGREVVRHEPNLSSGGNVREHGVQEFPDRTGSAQAGVTRETQECQHLTGKVSA